MAAYRTQVQEALRLMAQVPQTGGVNYVAVFVLYLAATQERRIVNEFAAEVRRYAPGTGGNMLTYAEELRQEDKLEGQVETIESLLTVGADWEMITMATGITPARFQEIKAELQRLRTAQANPQ